MIKPRIITPASRVGAPEPQPIAVDLPQQASPAMRSRIIPSSQEPEAPQPRAPASRTIAAADEPLGAPKAAPTGRTIIASEHPTPAPAAAPGPRPVPRFADAPSPSFIQNAAPAPSAVPAFAAPPRAHDRVDALALRAAELDPVIGANPRIRPKIREVLDTPITEWTNWGSDDLAVNVSITNEQVKIAQAYSGTRIKNWIADTKDASSKPRGFLDRLSGKAKPAYYESMLTGARDQCQSLLSRISPFMTTIKPKVENLQLHCVAMQVAAEGLTDSMHQMLASNRVRTLLNGAQTALVALATFEQLQMQIIQDVGDADMLLTSVIPNWKVAEANA
ncbi:hypothetical protein CcrC1_gp243c [Caulobacter phage C1]|nr:hypothetical protein CcrC1_gp243c [Caulobacter phage C1]UTU08472.1 hypothetical protein CcrC2_gp244c [Caulobacter phage C2]UTU08987.1 hypothetical protein CcrJ4_gp238c [Caulobacter phage J4]UTU09548.1 hypothetical protein CcrBL47_gp262c [Caulobacter phage BL47]UTU10105.1 hypothetical protein CcrRB23_gp243c [Caulobacter phage RB23]WGN97140.1 hypothetical protein [Bertelyvirus sp.]